MRLVTVLVPFLSVVLSGNLVFCQLSERNHTGKGLQTDFRLPNNSLPLRYDLWLKTDVDKADFNFSGRVKIHVKIVEATQLITLHYRRINIDNVDLLNVDKKVIAANLTFVCERFSFLDISLPQIMAANEEIVLDISYRGELLGVQRGFYRASYQKNDSSNSTVWYATTHFEAVHARHAMPCYDEPAIRAVIAVEIQHDKSYNAISNMPIVSREAIAGTDYVTSKFQDTPPMQSYLLAFVISDFTFISNNDSKVEQRIYAKLQSIEKGEGDFASSIVGPMMRKMEEHFGIAYPLPKMDHAAITQFKAGAMENFGLIMYRESKLLFEPLDFGSIDNEKKIIIIKVIAHELAHQYFGNIVSPKWWSHLWLNEGFAKFYNYFIPSLLYPKENYMKRFRKEVVRPFMKKEITRSSRPLSQHFETYIDTIKCFDTVNYYKSASVLWMFHEAMTVETFTKGIRYYLKAMYYSAASPDDLHRELQKAFIEDFPGNEVNIGEAMKTWEDQAGIPMIHVDKSDNKFILTQKILGAESDEIFTIPISYASKSDPNFKNKTVKLWMKTKTAEIECSSDDDWIILNIQSTGFYETKLGPNIQKALFEQLKTDHEKLPEMYKSLLFTDVVDLLKNSKIDAIYGLKLLSYLKHEKNSSFLGQSNEIASLFHQHLFGTPALPLFEKFFQTLAEPHFDRLGFEKVEGESTDNTEMRSMIIRIRCKTNQKDCSNTQLKDLEDFLATGKGDNDLYEGLKLANASVHFAVIEKFTSALNTSSEDDKRMFFRSLGCSFDREILRSNLDLVLSNSTKLDVNNRLSILQGALTKSPTSMEVTLDFMLEHIDEILKVIPNKVESAIKRSIVFINSEENFTKVKTILKSLQISKEIDGIDGSGNGEAHSSRNIGNIDMTWYTEQFNNNMEWNKNNFKEIENWLAEIL